jgi:hypothetical protein
MLQQVASMKTQVFVALILLTACDSQHSDTVKMTTQAPTATVSEIFHLRSECSNEAEKVFKEVQALAKNSPELAKTPSNDDYRVHYNVKLNRCYVVWMSHAPMPAWGPGGHIANYDLEDIQESATLAHLTWNSAHGHLFINDCTLPPDLHNRVGHGDARSLADEIR